MKAIVLLKNTSMVAAGLFVLAGANFGQTVAAKKADEKTVTAKDPNVIPLPAPTSANEKPVETTVDDKVADEILPYYTNYLKEYRLGPSDLISVEVFGQCPEYTFPSIIKKLREISSIPEENTTDQISSQRSLP